MNEKYRDIFEGKKVTQMGLGILGRGVGDARFLAENGADLLVTDLKDEEALATSVDTLRQYSNITFRLGEHRVEDFTHCDLVLKGAGVPKGTEFIVAARRVGVPVDMSASLLMRVAQVPVVGVTGTRGKSTVTQYLYEVLKHEGRHVLLGGNVKGVSNLSLLRDVTEESVAVLELDSWQCQGFGEEKSINNPRVRQGPLSPQVAVFTSFMPDHLNYYKGDLDAYLADKANIFLYQSEGDVLVVGKQAFSALQKYKKDIRANVVVADESDVPKNWKLSLLGEHNRYNAGIAVATARAFGVSDEVIQEVVENMKALPGRLELVKEVKGLRFYNDTNATTPEAVVAALKAFSGEGNVRLIAGGTEKDLDNSALLPAIEKYAKQVVFLKGTGTENLLADKEGVYEVVDSLEEAFNMVLKGAGAGDIVLFSPGFSSFGMFNNEYDRGEQYNVLVRSL